MIALILLSIFIAFGSVVLAIVAAMGGLTFQIYLIVSTVVTAVMGLVFTVIFFLTDGVIGPFLIARLRGKDLVAVITPNKKIELLPGREEVGMLKTKRGYFMISPGTVYRWANGVNGGFAYFKYGVTLPTKIVKAASKLKSKGITDIKILDRVVKKLRDEGKELAIRVD